MTETAILDAPVAPVEIPSPVVPYVEIHPVSVILDGKLRARFYAEIEGAIAAFVPNLETAKSRQEVASLAFKIARTKTAIDTAGKILTEDARAYTDRVNAARADARNTLDILRDRARKPLDEWEEKEEERKKRSAEILGFLDRCRTIYAGDTSASVMGRLERAKSVPDEEEFATSKASAVEALEAALVRITEEEANKVELERLREAEAARLKAAAEAEAAAARLAAREEKKARAAAAENDRIAKAATDAAEKAAQAERAAAAAEIEKVTNEKLALERAEAERLTAEKAAAEEEEHRRRNKKHRAEVMDRACTDIVTASGVSEEAARRIVNVIAEDGISHISIKF